MVPMVINKVPVIYAEVGLVKSPVGLKIMSKKCK